MSKSLGNFTTTTDAITQHHPDVIRYFLLSSHYRSEMNFDETNLNAAKSAIDRLRRAFDEATIDGLNWRKSCNNRSMSGHLDGGSYYRAFVRALCDDFNTPVAFSQFFYLLRDINHAKQENNNEQRIALLGDLQGCIELVSLLRDVFVSQPQDEKIPSNIAQITDLVYLRETAKQQQDWVRADAIRQQLQAQGFVLTDTKDAIIVDGPSGTKFKLARVP